jgi:hypothetical protein
MASPVIIVMAPGRKYSDPSIRRVNGLGPLITVSIFSAHVNSELRIPISSLTTSATASVTFVILL